MVGIKKMDCALKDDKMYLSIDYNCEIIKGRELGDVIREADSKYTVINQRVESFQIT